MTDQAKLSQETPNEAATRIKNTFMAKISHELRSPLTGIIGFAELMYHGKVGNISTDQKEYLGDILTSARHLLLLINDVLDLSKVESGKMEFNAEEVDFKKIMDETKGIFQTFIENKKIKFIYEIDPSIGKIKIDPGRFKQVLYNFVSNALKCTDNGGQVTIRIQPENAQEFRLEVTDTGIGIHEEDMKKLFIEFQQIDRDIAKKYSGTGLGLALVKNIVEAQHGKVGAKSIFGKGSTFYAILPKYFSTSQ